MPEVSVIVPVYNAQKYLGKCIESILGQSFTDLELILVEDGSPDDSGKICDDYAKKDSRIKVIHKQNGGVSAARNDGLDAAAGRYVMFVDSDDTIDSHSVKTLYTALLESGSDLCAMGVRFVFEKDLNKTEYPLPQTVFDVSSISEYYQMLSDSKFFGTMCAKLFKTSVIKEHGIRFNKDFYILEDGAFVSEYLGIISSVSLVSDCFYNYLQTEDFSLMKKFNENAVLALENKMSKDVRFVSFLDEKTKRVYYFHLFETFTRFVVQIYNRSSLLAGQKKTVLKKYLNSNAAKQILSSLRLKDILILRHKVFYILFKIKAATLFHLLMSIR